MAKTVYIKCPRSGCNEELPFEIEHHCDGGLSVGLIADAQPCECQFTDETLETLESEAAQIYTENLGTENF